MPPGTQSIPGNSVFGAPWTESAPAPERIAKVEPFGPYSGNIESDDAEPDHSRTNHSRTETPENPDETPVCILLGPARSPLDLAAVLTRQHGA
jgi:hypothetical protein